jgi:diacylglycerol kinase (ATP)
MPDTADGLPSSTLAVVSFPTLVVVNPQSRGGATGREWGEIEQALLARLGEFQIEFTRGPGDAERIAARALREGVGRLVVAGGDGTVSQVVTGVLSECHSAAARVGPDALGASADVPHSTPSPEIGWLPLGTGGDLSRAFALKGGVAEAIERLASGETRPVDVGRIRCRGRDGGDHTSYFLNIASLGIGGLVDEFVTDSPLFLGGSIAFALAALRAFAAYRPKTVQISIDGEPLFEGQITLVAVANGSHFGGGMHIAPGARPDDGAFEVVIMKALSKLGLLANLPSLYRGTHLSNPVVSCVRGVRIDARVPSGDESSGDVLLDVDGEPLGTLPASIELLPSALTLCGAGRAAS